MTASHPLNEAFNTGYIDEVEKPVVPISVYDSLKLNKLGLSRQAFDVAINGFGYLRSSGQLTNDRILTIADFSQPSSKKRLYVIDIKNYQLVFNTYVAHGAQSGKEMATQFSNTPESNQSSLGFYRTMSTYDGCHGYSLKLEGLENGINSNAYSRAIVMHSADYVSEDLIRSQGYIGRSWGCPALSPKMNKPVIDKIRNGSCFFIYSTNHSYLSQSRIAKKMEKKAA